MHTTLIVYKKTFAPFNCRSLLKYNVNENLNKGNVVSLSVIPNLNKNKQYRQLENFMSNFISKMFEVS